MNFDSDQAAGANLEYAVRGASAFDRASLDAAATWLDARPDLKEYEQREEIKQTLGLWGRFEKFGRRVLFASAVAMALRGDGKVLLDLGRQTHLLPATTSDTSAPHETNVEFNIEISPPVNRETARIEVEHRPTGPVH